MNFGYSVENNFSIWDGSLDSSTDIISILFVLAGVVTGVPLMSFTVLAVFDNENLLIAVHFL